MAAPVEQLEPGQAAFNDLTLKYYDLQDSLAGLTQALEASFHNVQIDIIGCVAQFSRRA
jgi:hypothetical protein